MNRNNLQSFSQNHWTGKTDGAHRESSEEWLSKYAHELLAMLPIRGTLLDVGCGSCQVTTYLAREFDQVYGIDFSESMLSAGRERISSLGVRNIELMFGTAQAFPHAIGHPTVILSHAVIQYMPLGDFRRHLYECRRVLAQGGVVCAAQIPNSELKKIYYRGRLVPLQDRFAGRLRRQLELWNFAIAGIANTASMRFLRRCDNFERRSPDY